MSSKVHRGGIPIEPIAWRSVGSNEEHRETRGPASEFVPPQASAGGGRNSRNADDTERKIRAAYQQGVQEGQASVRQEMGAQLEAMNVRMARAIEEMSGMRQRFRQ